MKKLILSYLSNVCALFILDYFLGDLSFGGYSLFLFAIFMTFVTVYIKPFLKFISLPLNILSLGLFSMILNAAIFGFGAAMIPGVTLGGFQTALIGSVLYGAVSAVLAFVF